MTCDLCRLLFRASVKLGGGKPTIAFERDQSKLKMSGLNFPPALSIFRSPELRTPIPIQVGFPNITEIGSPTFFAVLSEWVRNCNQYHHECLPAPHAPLPTRVIDVGKDSDPTMKLYETANGEIGQYTALSHPWGDAATHKPFQTLRSNYEAFKQEIVFDQLPQTFKDAVITTRAMGVRFLWIDSICIIQGPDGDFSDQAARMEDVYSSAYCVLTASRATGQHDGFLGTRTNNDFVAIRQDDQRAPFYIAEMIDDFARDVLDGHLNRRGWVLQERALAKRTIYFAHTQAYFECGKGVRCETMTKMNNHRASVLGDPNFPTVAMRSSRGGKIRVYQDVYETYSRLEFSCIEDRPVAIGGLEKRLLHAFNTFGGYGVFDDGPGGGLLQRSLAWHRGEDELSLTRIEFPTQAPRGHVMSVPTWSWMAYRGGINYLDLPFSGVEWDREIYSPWTLRGRGSAPADSRPIRYLGAVVRGLSFSSTSGDEARLIIDAPGGSGGQQRHCVVLGRQVGQIPIPDSRHYFLVVAPAPSDRRTSDGKPLFERVGAGFLPGRFIDLEGKGTMAMIR